MKVAIPFGGDLEEGEGDVRESLNLGGSFTSFK